MRKLAFKWKSDGIDSKIMKKIQKIANQFSKDIIESTKYALTLSNFRINQTNTLFNLIFFVLYLKVVLI